MLEIIKSIRFWLLVISAVLGVLVSEGIVTNEIANAILTMLSWITGGTAAVGMIDKAAINIGRKK